MKIDELVSRRSFLEKIGAVGLAGFGIASLTACGSGESGQSETEASDGARTSADGDPCSDLSGLSESQIQTRESVGYVKETSDPESRCDNCSFWLPPDEGEPCGGCVVVAGPIHPEGYCNSWAPMSET